MSSDRKDKEDVVHTHGEGSLSHGKEGDLAACNNMDEPGGRCAKWNKPTTEGKMLQESIYVRSLE